MEKDLKTFVNLCNHDSYTVNDLKFCYFTEWVRTTYPTADRINLVKDGEDTLVNGYEGAKLMFTLRHVDTEVADITSSYVNYYWEKNGQERIHVSEFKGDFANWIKNNFPTTTYVYISALPSRWSIKLFQDRTELYTFGVKCT